MFDIQNSGLKVQWLLSDPTELHRWGAGWPWANPVCLQPDLSSMTVRLSECSPSKTPSNLNILWSGFSRVPSEEIKKTRNFFYNSLWRTSEASMSRKLKCSDNFPILKNAALLCYHSRCLHSISIWRKNFRCLVHKKNYRPTQNEWKIHVQEDTTEMGSPWPSSSSVCSIK